MVIVACLPVHWICVKELLAMIGKVLLKWKLLVSSLETRKKYSKIKYWVEILLKMYYATEVNSLSTYLPSQYGYPNERNFKVKCAREEKIARVQCP